MKRILLIITVLISMAARLDASPSSPLDAKVRLQFVSIDMFVALAQLADQVGLTLIHEHAGPTGAPRISVSATDASAFSVLDDISQRTHTAYLVCGRALVVGDAVWLSKYRDTTRLVVTYTRIDPNQAATIVQNVYPYVTATVKGQTVTFVVPRVHLDRVQDVAQRLDAAP